MASTATFDDDSRGAEALILAAARSAGADATEFLLEEANRTVPIEEATLEGSGTADFDDATLQGTITYDTPYAARQHEETTWRHDPGRRAKWLELTMIEQGPTVGEYVAAQIRGVVG